MLVSQGFLLMEISAMGLTYREENFKLMVKNYEKKKQLINAEFWFGLRYCHL